MTNLTKFTDCMYVALHTRLGCTAELFTAQKVIEEPLIARENFSNALEEIAQSHDAVCPLTYSNGCPTSKQMCKHSENPASTAKFGYAALKTALGVPPVHQRHPKLH